MGKYVAAFYQGHDSSLAIVGEGRIVHFEAERLSRTRHDSADMSRWLIDACAQLGIQTSDIAAFAGISGAMGAAPSFYRTEVELHRSDRSACGVSRPTYCFPHHIAHVAYALYSSPYAAARIIAIDACGDGQVMPFRGAHMPDCMYGWAVHPFGQCEPTEMRITRLTSQCVGACWIEACQALYGRPNCEGKIMALCGVPSSMWESTGFTEEQRVEIRQLQEFTNQRFLELAAMTDAAPFDHGRNRAPLAFAGGCALNGIAVYNILKQRYATQIHVPPSVDDGGISVGAAMYVLHAILGEPRVEYSPDTIAFAGFTEPELEGAPPADRIAELLADGKVVALAHGRAESGPRALGHRSILADPRSLAMKDRINQIKGREAYRPVAPVVMKEYADDLFDLIDHDAYRYMTTIAQSKPRMQEIAPAGVHYDGSARVQVVEKGHTLYPILERFYALTGVPVLLNTSFNIGGEAMCNSAAHARDTFARSTIDVLCVGSELTIR